MQAISHTAHLTIGAAICGGFFAGTFRLDDDLFGLIVAPKAYGEIKSAWNSQNNAIVGASSYNDGMANTQAMAEAGSTLGKWAAGLNIDGKTDWYLPSRDELEMIYRNLKPTEEESLESFRDGDNASSIPPGYPYTDSFPLQTSVAAFRAGGEEALEPVWHWASTQDSADTDYAWYQGFSNGYQGLNHKAFEGRARAVRRFAL